jgi:hypothetical protein
LEDGGQGQKKEKKKKTADHLGRGRLSLSDPVDLFNRVYIPFPVLFLMPFYETIFSKLGNILS